MFTYLINAVHNTGDKCTTHWLYCVFRNISSSSCY